MGGLRLDSREALLKGGDTGPGHRARQARDEHPRQGAAARRRLSGDAARAARSWRRPTSTCSTEWVRAGAPWPARQPPRPRPPPPGGVAREGRSRRSSARSGRSSRWQRTRRPAVTDAGVAEHRHRPLRAGAAREREGSDARSAPPTSATLLRRAHLRPHRPAADARGGRRVPEPTRRPTPSTKVVDRLLASPHYGETLGPRTGSTWPATARTTTAASIRAARLHPYPERATSIATG